MLGHKLCRKPHGKVVITILHFSLWALLGSHDVLYQSMSVFLSSAEQKCYCCFLCISHGVLFCSVDMPSVLSFSSVSAQHLGSWAPPSRQAALPSIPCWVARWLGKVTQRISMGSLCAIAENASLHELLIDDSWYRLGYVMGYITWSLVNNIPFPKGRHWRITGCSHANWHYFSSFGQLIKLTASRGSASSTFYVSAFTPACCNYKERLWMILLWITELMPSKDRPDLSSTKDPKGLPVILATQRLSNGQTDLSL